MPLCAAGPVAMNMMRTYVSSSPLLFRLDVVHHDGADLVADHRAILCSHLIAA